MNSNWDGINNQLAQRDMFFTITPRVGVGNPNRCVCDILEPPKCIHSSKFTPLSPFFFILSTHPIPIGLGLNCSEDKNIGWGAWPQLIAWLGITLRQKVKSRDKATPRRHRRSSYLLFALLYFSIHGRPPRGPTNLTPPNFYTVGGS